VPQARCRAIFALRRGLRIYPGLMVNVALCAWLLGPLVTSLPVSAYFAGPELRDFLVKTLTLNPWPGWRCRACLFADNAVGLHITARCGRCATKIMMYLMIVMLGMARLLRAVDLSRVNRARHGRVYFEHELTPLGDFGNGPGSSAFRRRDGALFPARPAGVRWRGALIASWRW